MVPPPHFLPDHHPTGVSTGVYQELRGDWSSMIREAAQFSPYAVELSALGESELEGLLGFLAAGTPLPFRYVSVHAPTKGRELPERDLVARLARAPGIVRAILTHPDVIEDPSAYVALGWRLCVENMDSRKTVGQSPESLARIFDELPEAGFVFDIAHAHEVDPSMSLASELLDRFRGRLRHVHVSSIRNGHHVPLTEEDEATFAPHLARCLDVPWILEALPPRRWSIAPSEGFGAAASQRTTA